MPLRIPTGKFNRPPFVHNAFPPKDEKDDPFIPSDGSHQFGVKGQRGGLSDKGVFESKRIVKTGFKTLDEIKQMFGEMPHDATVQEFKHEVAGDGKRPHALKFISLGSMPGEWVVKKVINAHGVFEIGASEAKRDILLKRIVEKFFPEHFKVPETYWYNVGDDCYIVSK